MFIFEIKTIVAATTINSCDSRHKGKAKKFHLHCNIKTFYYDTRKMSDYYNLP